ncbi:MAG: tyrosine-type recombinase/integrase [Candidatus Thiodiazotropha endolucinida]
MSIPITTTDLARLLQAFFCQYLTQQRRVSHQTVRGYRDTFRLLLHLAEQKLGKRATDLRLADIDAPLVLAFLENLETKRHNCIRSRNTRLAAIRSFMNYAAVQEPAALPGIQQVLAIPMKRFDRPVVGFLTQDEMQAILEAPDTHTWSGQRDRAILSTLYNSGARVSEIIAVRRIDIESEQCQAIHLHGKGRKERVVPLWTDTSKLLRAWVSRIDADPQQPLFPNRFGQMLSRSGVESRLRRAAIVAANKCPSLRNKSVSPHVIRHTTAMHLLQAGVDLTVIALWLGHESIVTTHQYLDADLQMKEQTLAILQPPGIDTSRYKPSTDVLSFLDGL